VNVKAQRSCEKKMQQRSCVVCRKPGDKAGLLRLVCTEEGQVILDKGLKLQGRGAYLHSNLACVMKADNARIWQHVFKNKLIDKDQVRLVITEVKKFLIK
jgi:predicted RNA-binding protein YlxR (DUF448 family)